MVVAPINVPQLLEIYWLLLCVHDDLLTLAKFLVIINRDVTDSNF